MDYLSVRPKKHLGQHFLRDPNISAKVAHALTGHGAYDQIIEVGPGTGALTKVLLDDGRFLWYGIDPDSESIAYLVKVYPQHAPRLIGGDFLKIDIRKLTGGRQTGIVGNFPYNISSQILFRVLEHRDIVPEMVGMFQREVALRIVSQPGNKVYGILSVLTQAFYQTELLFQVSEHVFDPPPKVKSAVIRLQRKPDYRLACKEDLFYRVVKAAFNQRRKTLKNALSGFNPDWNNLPDKWRGERAENLGWADYIQLTASLEYA